MKNLSRAYMNHPELVWVFLTILLLSMFLLPLLQCHFYRKKQDKIKKYAVSYISRTGNLVLTYDSSEEKVSKEYSSIRIFDYDLKIKSGKCVAAQKGFGDFLEPRFTANILLNSETESLKVLSDLSSVFRGIFYFI